MDNFGRETDIVYYKNKNIVMRIIHGTCFLIDISDKFSGDKCALYEVNPTGKFVWENINGMKIDDLASKLKAAIVDDVDYDIIYDDVMNFVCDLLKRNFVEVC